ncbi:MAG TPA: 2'-5' RNA ligase family protein [Anaerolineales bacterium]|nr:2'-5' RNA ligase family protein [Anaerolineales bacterium]
MKAIKATFALLANTEVHNLVRKLAWEIHRKYHTGTDVCRLPPHISLKQPFATSNLASLEEYMDELAKSITPFDVYLTELQLVPLRFEGMEFGLLWIDVQETETLRQLHNRINEELSQQFGHTQADFDGMTYHFHMTVMMGGQPMDIYRKLFSEFPDAKVDMRYTVHELAMFLYDEPMGPKGEYLTYKILPIGRMPI